MTLAPLSPDLSYLLGKTPHGPPPHYHLLNPAPVWRWLSNDVARKPNYNRLSAVATENAVHFCLQVFFHLFIPISIRTSLCLHICVCLYISVYFHIALYVCAHICELCERTEHLLRAEQAESGWVVVVELRLVFCYSTGFGLVGFGKKYRWRIYHVIYRSANIDRYRLINQTN